MSLTPGNFGSMRSMTCLPPSRSWTLAAVITATRSRPLVSTTIWRLEDDKAHSQRVADNERFQRVLRVCPVYERAANCRDSHTPPSIFKRTVTCSLGSAPQLHE